MKKPIDMRGRGCYNRDSNRGETEGEQNMCYLEIYETGEGIDWFFTEEELREWVKLNCTRKGGEVFHWGEKCAAYEHISARAGETRVIEL